MTVALALLRGINVGGKATLPMRELAEIFAVAGASDVSTYIQSGNVIFRADAPEKVTALVTERVRQRYGYPGRIVVLTRGEMESVTGGNPYAKAGVDAAWLHVYFLADAPSSVAVKQLDASRSAPDSFVVRGRAIYLHLPNGMARTKLTNAYFDAQLKTVCTARNWKTTMALYERMCGREKSS